MKIQVLATLYSVFITTGQKKVQTSVQGNPNPNNDIHKVCNGKGNDKVYPRTSHEGAEVE
jgi:hypothetical protein